MASKGDMRVSGRSVVLAGSVVSGDESLVGKPVELRLARGFNDSLSGSGDTFFAGEKISAGYTFQRA